VRRDLEKIFGADAVREATEEDGRDRTENTPRRPAFVVTASDAAQVPELLKWANRKQVPVTPRVTGLNIGGLAIPADGGIVLDLARLDAIDLDHEHMIAWIEPGVTWEQLKHVAARYELVLGFPLAPPDTSVLACALMDGLSTMALAHGSYGDWVTGVEAYLADGTRVVTGSAAVSGRALSRGPLPDLTGLFISWFGSTGIVTRLGLHLWPKRAFRRREVIACPSAESAVVTMRKGARTGLFDDLGTLGWPAAKWAFGLGKLGPRDPAEPECYLVADYASDDADDLDRRARVLASIAPTPPMPVDDLIRLAPDLAPIAELPTRLDFFLDHEGGGLSWIGTYGPLDRLAEGARAGIRLCEQHGHPPLLVSRPMKGGHFAVLRFIERFDRNSAEETAGVRALNVALGRALLELGYVPYKCPAILHEEVFARLDPGFVDVMRRVKKAVDPHGILNPDRWRFEEPVP
jgi:FAD/FMN-containing dehydrogenase